MGMLEAEIRGREGSSGDWRASSSCALSGRHAASLQGPFISEDAPGDSSLKMSILVGREARII